MLETITARRGMITTRPSCSRAWMASRMGVLLTPISCMSAVWSRIDRGISSQLMILALITE